MILNSIFDNIQTVKIVFSMKILLVGEYSRLHNSLKEGLVHLGHEVTIIATGDYFKNFPADIKLERRFNSGISKKIKVLLFKLFKIDITSNAIEKQFFKHQDKLKDFDVVQLINESPLGITAAAEKRIFDFLASKNSRIFLLSCGTDVISVKYAFEKHFRYSIMTPYFEGKIVSKHFAPLKYLRPDFIALHQHVYQNIAGVIASDFDYHLPLMNHPKYLGLIPNPINIDKITYIPPVIDDKIIIFHGINSTNFYKKGNDLFEKALQIIQKKYADKVAIIVTYDVPYATYINHYNNAHILLDQIYAYDQGYNALEAMAKGKVVFTGAETEFLKHYHLEEDQVCINALPDVDALVAKLSWLIEHPESIITISKNARFFIEKEHHYMHIINQYLKIWNKI